MSTQDLDRLVEAVREANREATREANKPLGNKILLASASVVITLICACLYVGGTLRDVENLKKFQSESQPIITKNTTDIAIINTVLKIKQ